MARDDRGLFGGDLAPLSQNFYHLAEHRLAAGWITEYAHNDIVVVLRARQSFIRNSNAVACLPCWRETEN